MSSATLPNEETVWAAVGEPNRRLLLDVLLAGGPASASALAREVPVTRQAVAKHLAVLESASLVEARRAGREVRYAVRPAELELAVRTMAATAARWDARLLAIKRIAEAVHRRAQAP